jgi:N-acetylneuraminic acid mutarotase
MRSYISAVSIIATLSSLGCGGGSAGISAKSTPSSNASEWIWVAGSNTSGQAGVYGTKGTPATGNTPGDREGAMSWTDESDNLWLFGGIAPPSATTDNYLNDLWEYSAGQWTWIGGSDTYNQAGIYGNQGTPASGNIPGARFAAVSWKDQSGHFWLFGGLGLDINGSSEFLNDLWEYSAGQWTWIGGPSVALPNQPGIYGAQGTAASNNIPGGRSNAVSWTDASGTFWLFSGSGLDSAGNIGNLNDLWKYSAGEWTWMGGANVINEPGTYGVEGTAAPSNIPSARFGSAVGTDAAGNLWLFGGSTGTNSFEPMNDLWKYSAGQWTWQSGSTSPDQNGVYGTQGVASAANTPGARVEAAAWTDSSGNLWLFGGSGCDSVGNVGALNDLWEYSAGQWTWVAGSNMVGQQGIYGTLGVATPGNVPGARLQASSWLDSTGYFWLFGGDGYNTNGYLNDLWKYKP